MDVAILSEVVGAVGFPIVCALGMGWFIYQVFLKTTAQNQENMKQVQERCAAREEKLYTQIEKAQEINGKAIATITLYAERLTDIQQDVKDIKNAVMNRE